MLARQEATRKQGRRIGRMRRQSRRQGGDEKGGGEEARSEKSEDHTGGG